MYTIRNLNKSSLFLVASLSFITACQQAPEEEKLSDSVTLLHTLAPDYDVPYEIPAPEQIEQKLVSILDYLDATTHKKLVDKPSGNEITDLSQVDENTILAPGDFRLISYEWGVTYAGMLNSAEATGNSSFKDYTFSRFSYIKEILPYFQALDKPSVDEWNALTSVTDPRALDHAGAMCAAMVKALQSGFDEDLNPIINNYADYIHNKQFRLDDGTLARNRPQPNTIWLDDLFMSVPALARMGSLTEDAKYFDDAVKQVIQFSERMFNNEKGLYMHGWVQEMEDHPEFYWARANGWALMAKVELLDVLPKEHPGYNIVMELLKKHIKGLSSYQSGQGFWHQLLDKTDSYLETSATAIYTYSMAKAINEGWIDKKSYGPMVLLAWNAVSTKINTKGQVEGTCVGTGMAFDPAFYYYRPVNVYAAHGYGPALLAGSEMIKLVKNNKIDINDSALQIYD